MITFGGSQANTNVGQITADATFLTSGTVDRTLAFTYDAASQLTAAEDTDSEYAYTYDNLGRVLTTSNSGTSGVPTVVLTSAYDANGNRTSLAATRGGTADFLNSYTLDNLGRMTRVEQTGNSGHTVASKRADFAYNALGQFSTITRQVKPSSTWDEVATSTFTYDTRNRLTALDHKHSTTDIANYDWTYDAMDRVLQFSGPDGTSDYTYDKESQVTATDHSFQSDESYAYTATGNRTGGGYSVASNNRMTSDGTYNYTYDDEGNRLTHTKISDSSLTEYTWDHRNRLTKVVERAAGAGQPITKQTDYKYDIFDRRISKSYDADGAGGGSAIVSRFVYDGDHIALQFDGSNNLTHRYLHGPAIDQILADEDGSNAILWSLTDNLGTVRDLVNNSGTIQNHIKYDAFGKVTAESNAAVDHIFGYTSRERDEETGLAYYRKRNYDPATGRFLSQDPDGFAAGDTNLSRYVGNNATNMVDPYGLEGEVTHHGVFTYTPSEGYSMYNAGDPAYKVAYAAWLKQGIGGAGSGNGGLPDDWWIDFGYGYSTAATSGANLLHYSSLSYQLMGGTTPDINYQSPYFWAGFSIPYIVAGGAVVEATGVGGIGTVGVAGGGTVGVGVNVGGTSAAPPLTIPLGGGPASPSQLPAIPSGGTPGSTSPPISSPGTAADSTIDPLTAR